MKPEDFRELKFLPPTLDNIRLVEEVSFRQDQNLMDAMMALGVDKGKTVRYINLKYGQRVNG